MQLREGIRVVGHNPRIWISDGMASASQLGAAGYYDKAILPRRWREPTPDEHNKLLDLKVRQANQTSHVGVVRLPKDFLERISANTLGDASSLDEFIGIVQQAPYKDLERDLITLARTLLIREEDFIAMSPVINPPGRTTVTLMGPTGQLLGLHLDSWGASPLSERSTASNRISINLGRDSRYLLFINLTMSEILEALPENERQDTRAVQAFMELYPNYPVVKVRVGPGEAYIAPTENMIHDGSSEDRISSDIHLTLRGHFRVDLDAWKA